MLFGPGMVPLHSTGLASGLGADETAFSCTPTACEGSNNTVVAAFKETQKQLARYVGWAPGMVAEVQTGVLTAKTLANAKAALAWADWWNLSSLADSLTSIQVLARKTRHVSSALRDAADAKNMAAGSAPSAAPASASAKPYTCGLVTCSSADPAITYKFKDTQALYNKFAIAAKFSPVAVDGKLGSGTVAAANKVNTWLTANGGWVVQTVSKEQLADSSASGALQQILRAAIAQTNPPQARPPSGIVPSPAAGAVAPFQPPKTPVAVPSWVKYAAAGLGGFAILAIAYKLSSRPTRAPAAVALP